MSHARGYPNAGHFYSNIVGPVKIDCNFIVDSTNGNGLGIRSLKSNGYIQNVFMHTSASPGTNNGYLNPNPASGYALIQYKYNFNKYLGGFNGFVSPVSGTPINVTTGTTAGLAYIIISVGTTTIDQWQKLGLPLGVTPAVGVSFIAIATTTATGTGVIEVPAAAGSTISAVDVIGDANLSTTSNIAAFSGQWLLVRFSAATSSGTTTLVATAPANGSVVGMSSFFDNSSVTVDGL